MSSNDTQADFVDDARFDDLGAGPDVETEAKADNEPDPFDTLIAQTEADPGAPFAPDALEYLAELWLSDRARFESLRAKLKKARCRVGQLDKSLSELTGGDGRAARPTQADVLIGGANDGGELFHAPDQSAFLTAEVDGHRETWPVRSKSCRRWLTRQYFRRTGSAPSSEALQSALGVLESCAQFDGPEHDVHTRIAAHDGGIYLDLGTDDWTAARTVADGWEIVNRPPVYFNRTAGTLPLPVPVRGGSIGALRSFLNIGDDPFSLTVAWLLGALNPKGPYPILALNGEQGAAKSTTSRLLRSVVDPNTAPLRTLPRDERDLVIAANNAHVLAFDNVSGLPPWAADTLCRIATGAGFSTRELYSDTGETIINAMRPILLNGIEDVATRADLADRALVVTLEAIPEDRRREESELWAAFEVERPRILGALLDAVSRGLRMLSTTTLARKPRMADFARWVTACETAYSTPGTFLDAYAVNRATAAEEVIDSDPIASAIRAEMASRTVWTETALSLLTSLSRIVGEDTKRAREWPKTARGLSGRLRRIAPVLRKVDITITFSREGQARTRTITIARAASEPGQSSAPSAEQSDLFADDSREVAG